MITDIERADFLLRGGYISESDTGTDPTRTVDNALTRGQGPAYWRKPRTDAEERANCPPKGNGLVFVKPCDRDRIDQCILRVDSE